MTPKLAVDDQSLGFAVVQHEGDRGGIEAGVERVEHRAAHRRAIVAFEHRRRVGEHGGDGVAAPETPLGERGGEPSRAGGNHDSCGGEGREQSPNDREKRPLRVRETKAASEAGSLQGCDRGRGRKPRGTSRGNSGALRSDHSAPNAHWEGSHRSQWRKANSRKPTKVRTIAAPLPRRRKSAGSPASRQSPLRARKERKLNRPRS